MSRCDLFPSAEALLADIREHPYPIPFSERPARQFALDVMSRGKQVLNRLGLAVVQYQCGLNMLKGLAKLFSLYQGEDLVLELERFWERWGGATMPPDLVRAITSGTYRALVGRPPVPASEAGHELQ